MPQVIFTYIVFFLWMSCSYLSTAQPLEIDTVVTSNVESDHFKIRLPKVANIESYEILFSNYGVFNEIEIEGEIQQFVGDYNNIQRTKAINQKLKKQGIEPTLITFFIQPVLEIKEEAISQQAITGELSNKSLSFSRKVVKTNTKGEETDVNMEDQQGNQKVTENISTKKSSKNAEENKLNQIDQKKENTIEEIVQQAQVEMEPVDSTITLPARPGVKNKSPEDGFDKLREIVKDTDSLTNLSKAGTNTFSNIEPDVENNLPQKLPESGEYVLLLPLVNNPQVYQIVLKDLGYVQQVELADGSLWHYFGFFDSKESATLFIPKLSERGFVKKMPVVPFKAVQQEAQLLYDETKIPIETKLNNIEKEKSPIPASINFSGEYFRIELPKVNNPEIFFKVFEDVGNTYSEIAPNGDAIYYIGAFETTDAAIKQLENLKPRGLSNGSIIRFSGEKRINPYRKEQLDIKKENTQQLEEFTAKKQEPLIKTNPKGLYQIQLGQVDNPEVFQEVFGDIGKIKVGYLEDETEFFYLGNYYLKEDAEFVFKQLKERGLTQMELVNIQAKNKPNTIQPVADQIQTSSNIIKEKETAKVDEPLTDKAVSPLIENPVANKKKVDQTSKDLLNTSKEIKRYRIFLGQLDNPKFYQNILKEFGTVKSVTKDAAAVYYLESFSTTKVAQLVVEEIKSLGIETPLKIEAFQP